MSDNEFYEQLPDAPPRKRKRFQDRVEETTYMRMHNAVKVGHLATIDALLLNYKFDYKTLLRLAQECLWIISNPNDPNDANEDRARMITASEKLLTAAKALLLLV